MPITIDLGMDELNLRWIENRPGIICVGPASRPLTIEARHSLHYQGQSDLAASNAAWTARTNEG